MEIQKTIAFLWCMVAGLFAEGQSRILFDEGWKFSLDDHKAAEAVGFDDRSWRCVELPHDWGIEGARRRQYPSKGGGGYFPAGIGWYRKTFVPPSPWKDKEVLLYFEGVYMNATVFVNGRRVGHHPYGYSTFYYNISSFLDPGHPNVIAVRVDNSAQPNCRWYSGSGIYRHVRVIVKDPVHIDPWGIFVETPEVSANQATVKVRTLLKNEGRTDENVVLSAVIMDKRDKVVASGRVNVTLDAKQEKELTQVMAVPDPLLWSVDSPDLYHVRMSVVQKGRVRDREVRAFGIRTIRFTTDHGFQLNGRSIKLYGGCVHHDNGCLGAAAFDRAEERKAGLLKAAGFNAVRTSHNPPSPAFLDACDRLGLLVVDEAFDGWRMAKTSYDYSRYFDSCWRMDLGSMVLRDRNHPCVILWSIGNEVVERRTPGAVQTAKALVSLVRRIDPTRPVTSAVVAWGSDWANFDSLFAVHDVAGYNYALSHAPSDHERVPGRLIIQTESYPRDAFANWDLVRSHSYILGDFVWTAMDYLGESGIGRNVYPGEAPGEHWEGDLFPWHGSYCGDIDLTGQRKPVSYYRSMLNSEVSSIYMAVREPEPDTGKIGETLWSVTPASESWTWPGREGKDMQVEVYSKHPRVRLYVNGRLAGEQPCTVREAYKAVFHLLYVPGTLKAVGVDGDQETDQAVLRTAGAPYAIRLHADRTALKADGQDLSFVDIEVTDESGERQPNADNRVVCTIDGPATIAGIANADMEDTDSYAGHTRKTWHGRALVVLRTTHKTGRITLTVTSAGLKGAKMVFNAGAL
jgi:beta-galactosidase